MLSATSPVSVTVCSNDASEQVATCGEVPVLNSAETKQPPRPLEASEACQLLLLPELDYVAKQLVRRNLTPVFKFDHKGSRESVAER